MWTAGQLFSRPAAQLGTYKLNMKMLILRP